MKRYIVKENKDKYSVFDTVEDTWHKFGDQIIVGELEEMTSLVENLNSFNEFCLDD